MDASNLTGSKNPVLRSYTSSGVGGMRHATGSLKAIGIDGVEHIVFITNNNNDGTETPEDASKDTAADTNLSDDSYYNNDEIFNYAIIGCDYELISSEDCIKPLQFGYDGEIDVGDDIFIPENPKEETETYTDPESILEQPDRMKLKRKCVNGDVNVLSPSPKKARLNDVDPSCIVLQRYKLIARRSQGIDTVKYNEGTLCGKYTEPKSITKPANTQDREWKDYNGRHPLVSPRSNARLTGIMNTQHLSDTKFPPCKLTKVQLIDVSNTQLTEYMLSEISKDITGYWKKLARKLKVPNTKIQEIHRDNINYEDICDKAFQMLIEWKESSLCNTAKDLYNSLIECEKADTALKHFYN